LRVVAGEAARRPVCSRESVMSQPFKVAAVQAAPSFLDVETGVRRAVGYVEEAAKRGAKTPFEKAN